MRIWGLVGFSPPYSVHLDANHSNVLSFYRRGGVGHNVCSYEPQSVPASEHPPSRVIASIEWDLKNLIRLAPGSDLSPVTWGTDGHLYASWGDGGGFGGTNRDGRVSLGFGRMEGSPQILCEVNIWGGERRTPRRDVHRQIERDSLRRGRPLRACNRERPLVACEDRPISRSVDNPGRFAKASSARIRRNSPSPMGRSAT